jgi:hypothetical protein
MGRPIGPDISKWQAHSDLSRAHGVDFVKLHDKADFIFLRAGYAGSTGGAWVDERVHEYMVDLAPLLRINPKPFTFYWFFRDDVSVMEQAERFAGVVNAWKHVINLDLVIDAEVFVKGALLSTQKIIDFQTTVEAKTQLKAEILYGRAAQLNAETVPGLPEVLPDLWVARYANFLDEQVDEPWEEGSNVEPRDYDDWTFWQYSASGEGAVWGVVSASIDRNVFNGTLEELRAKAGLDKPEEPDEPDEPWTGTEVETYYTGENFMVKFQSPSGWSVPNMIGAQFDKSKVGLITVTAVINGVPFRVWRGQYKYRDFMYLSRPEIQMNQGDQIVVEVEPIVEGPIAVMIAWR